MIPTVVPVASSVRWGADAHCFELHSADARVLERAAVVFRPWTPDVGAASTRSWILDSAAATWIVRTDQGVSIEVPSNPNAAVRRVEYLAVQSIFDGPPDLVTAHAALVAHEGRGVLIAGIPESGKSTLACALWRRGFALLGDDVAVVDLDQQTAAPAPRRVSLRASSRALLGDAFWTRIERAPASEPTDEGWVFHPDEVDGARPASVRVAAMVFLGRRGASSADAGGLLAQLPPAQAALALLPCLNLARRLDVAALIPRLTPFVMTVPGYDLRRGDLRTMAAAVESLLDT